MQIPILSGIYTDNAADFRTSYPKNLVPVPKDTGLSKGYLRFSPGLRQLGTGPGVDRGAITVFTGNCYRVMGSKVCYIGANGGVAEFGDVAGTGPVSMDYSTDRLCIVSGGAAYYLYATGLLQRINDIDLGEPIDVVWVDGYFMFTDGRYIYVTDLTDPTSIDPLKYAASEIDPDYIVGLLKYRNEVYVFNSNTIEIFYNIGGTGFPFTRLPGGLITKGCVGTHAKTLFAETFAWVGNARNEPPSVYIAGNGAAQKIATREIEERLAAYTQAELATTVVSSRTDRFNQHLIIKLPRETMVYDLAASVAAGQPVWFFPNSSVDGSGPWRATFPVYAYGKWIVGDAEDGRIGVIDESLVTQYGEIVGWQFETMFLYNESRGAILYEVELVGTTGRAPMGEAPTVFFSYTLDGLTWSTERQASMGVRGNTQQRVVWRPRVKMRNFMGLRFRGANGTPISWARLEVSAEPLNA